MKTAHLAIAGAGLLVFSLSAQAQSRSAGDLLPTVSFASVPLYPPLAQLANIGGVVRLKVTTDGERVAGTELMEGNKILAAAAANVRTWTFEKGKPTTFIVTFIYKVVPWEEWRGDPRNPVITLRLPTEVEVETRRFVTVDLAPDEDREPEAGAGSRDAP
jgi:hypothetical protein